MCTSFHIIVSTASGIAVALAGVAMLPTPARAEDAETAASPETEEDAETAASPEVEVIVVTARRREERLQDVPISVTQFTGADLGARKIDNTLEIQFKTPNLFFGRGNFNNTHLQIRGIGRSVYIFSKRSSDIKSIEIKQSLLSECSAETSIIVSHKSLFSSVAMISTSKSESLEPSPRAIEPNQIIAKIRVSALEIKSFEKTSKRFFDFLNSIVSQCLAISTKRF